MKLRIAVCLVTAIGAGVWAWGTFNTGHSTVLNRYWPVKQSQFYGQYRLLKLQPMLPAEAAEVFKRKGWRPATPEELKSFLKRQLSQDLMVATPFLSNCRWDTRYQIKDCQCPIGSPSENPMIWSRDRLGFDWGDSNIRWLARLN